MQPTYSRPGSAAAVSVHCLCCPIVTGLSCSLLAASCAWCRPLSRGQAARRCSELAEGGLLDHCRGMLGGLLADGGCCVAAEAARSWPCGFFTPAEVRSSHSLSGSSDRFRPSSPATSPPENATGSLMAARRTGLETLSAIPARGATRLLLRVRPVVVRQASAVLMHARRGARSV